VDLAVAAPRRRRQRLDQLACAAANPMSRGFAFTPS
jgi:hypothetical protein